MDWLVFLIAGTALLIQKISWLSGEKGKLLLPSTRTFFKENGWKRLLNLKAFHGYIYMRW